MAQTEMARRWPLICGYFPGEKQPPCFFGPNFSNCPELVSISSAFSVACYPAGPAASRGSLRSYDIGGLRSAPQSLGKMIASPDDQRIRFLRWVHTARLLINNKPVNVKVLLESSCYKYAPHWGPRSATKIPVLSHPEAWPNPKCLIKQLSRQAGSGSSNLFFIPSTLRYA